MGGIKESIINQNLAAVLATSSESKNTSDTQSNPPSTILLPKNAKLNVQLSLTKLL